MIFILSIVVSVARSDLHICKSEIMPHNCIININLDLFGYRAKQQRTYVKQTTESKVENTCPIDGFFVIEIITASSNQKEHFSLCV